MFFFESVIMNIEHPLLKYVKNKESALFIEELIAKQSNLKLLIVSERKTHIGLMQYHKLKDDFKISINNNLTPSYFLYVFLHEYAHLQVTVNNQAKRTKPHGKEWQQSFFSLLKQAIERKLFDTTIEKAIQEHFFKKEIYSRKRDFIISNIIFEAETQSTKMFVSDLKIGDIFTANKTLQLKVLEKRRTRYLCQDIHSKKKYLVSQYMPVSHVSQALF